MYFNEYADAGFQKALLPIIPPGADISPASKNPEALAANRGKIPGKYTTSGWVGFHGWSKFDCAAEDVAEWAGWGCGAGLNARAFPGLDIDVDDRELAAAVEALAVAILGPAPCRFGRGERRLLSYAATASLRKRRVAFRRAGGAGDGAGGSAGASEGAGDDARAVGDADALGLEVHAVEFLGDGQQYVVEGVHPKTGKPYWWRDGLTPARVRAVGLWEISAADLDAFYARLPALLAEHGYAVVGREDAGHTADGSKWSAGLSEPSEGAVERALAVIPNEHEYDDWFRLMAACRAALGPEGLHVFADWSARSGKDDPEVTEAKWESLRPPFAVGWPLIAAEAAEHGFNAAAEDFDVWTEPATPEEVACRDANAAAMFENCVWVSSTEQVFDIRTKRLRSRQQHNAAYWQVGDPADGRKCAWAVFMRDGLRRRTVDGVTYRPNGGLFIEEEVLGLCVNIWRPSRTILPASATDEGVETWLSHIAYLIPNEAERAVFLDWLAWVVQFPGLKPNFGIVLGSPEQGIGKSLLLEPVRAALGRHNVREIGPAEVASNFSGWMLDTKLIVVEEMHSYEKRETMNKMKSWLATPPWTLQVNQKFGRMVEIPNILAGIFFTNHENALALERSDRRFYVLWSDALPRPPSYYAELVAWFKDGGAALAARWLLDRDVSHFNAQGRAPATEAKEDMRKTSRTPLEEWLEEGIADEAGPFVADLVALEEVYDAMPDALFQKGARPTMRRLSVALRRAGGLAQARLRAGEGGARVQLYSLRRHSMYAGVNAEKLRDMFEKQRQEAATKAERAFR